MTKLKFRAQDVWIAVFRFCHGDTGCPVQNYIPEWNDLDLSADIGRKLSIIFIQQIIFLNLPGELCPAPCEAACALGINADPVSIKAIEKTIIDRGFE